MRRLPLLVIPVLAAAALAPAAASAGAATARIDSAGAHQRPDGRVELLVRVRHDRDARVDGHVKAVVLDRDGTVVARGRAHAVTHTRTGDRRHRASYRVVLAPAASTRAARLLRRDGRLRLRVGYRARVGAAGAAAQVAFDGAGVAATDSGIDFLLTGMVETSYTLVAGGQTYPNCQIGFEPGDPNFTVTVQCQRVFLELQGPVDVTTRFTVENGVIGDQDIGQSELFGQVRVVANLLNSVYLRGTVWAQPDA